MPESGSRYAISVTDLARTRDRSSRLDRHRVVRASVHWFVAVTGLLALTSYILVYELRLEDQPIHADAFSYYLYLPSWLLYGDPSFETASLYCCEGGALPGANRWPETGRWLDLVPIGVAVQMLPFFAAADLLSRWSNMPREGYSLYYQHGAGLAGLVYFLIGLAILRRFLLRHFGEGVVLATLMTITFGTNLFHYGTFDSTFSHAYSFFLITALMFLTERWWTEPRRSDAIALGVVSALIVLTRHPNGVFLALFPLYGVTRLRDLSTNAAILWRRRASVALIAAIGAACISPQLVIYKRTTGHWIVNAYIHGGFTFASPHLLDVLFSVQKGLFFWSPALALAVPGFFVARGACRRLALPVALIVAVHTYVVASWIVWYYGASYGHRAFTDTLGLLAAFIASFFAWVADRPRAAVMVAVATSAAVVLSVLQMIQYWNGVMPSGGPTWAQYRTLFLRFP